MTGEVPASPNSGAPLLRRFLRRLLRPIIEEVMAPALERVAREAAERDDRIGEANGELRQGLANAGANLANAVEMIGATRIDLANFGNALSQVEATALELVGSTRIDLANTGNALSLVESNVANLLAIMEEQQAEIRRLTVAGLQTAASQSEAVLPDRVLRLERCLGLDGDSIVLSGREAVESAFDQRAADIETRLLAYLEGPYLIRLAAYQSNMPEHALAPLRPQPLSETTMDASQTILNELIRLTNYASALQMQIDTVRTNLADRSRLDWLAERESRLPADRFETPVPAVIEPHAVDLDEQFARLRAAAPASFDAWLDRYEAGKAEYRKMAPDSLSTDAHHDAFYFRLFVNVHARGRVLDLGVGPLAVPVYLADLPPERLAGLDPLPGYEPHPFPFAQSVAEFMPWPDGSFETVIAATSIDHVYLLDRTYEEIARVLSPGGRLILWAGVFAETPPYNPYGEPVKPLDAFHLFHPGENWFVGAVPETFRLLERFEVCTIGYSNSFFAFEKV